MLMCLTEPGSVASLTKGHRALRKGQERPPTEQRLLPEGSTWAAGVESDKDMWCVCVWGGCVRASKRT